MYLGGSGTAMPSTHPNKTLHALLADAANEIDRLNAEIASSHRP